MAQQSPKAFVISEVAGNPIMSMENPTKGIAKMPRLMTRVNRLP